MRYTEFKQTTPLVGDILGLEFGDTLIEATISEIRDDGVVIQLDEAAVALIQETLKNNTITEDPASYAASSPWAASNWTYASEPTVSAQKTPSASQPLQAGNIDNAIEWVLDMFRELPSDIVNEISKSENGVIVSLLRRRAYKLKAFSEYDFDADDLRYAESYLSDYFDDPKIHTWKDMLNSTELFEAEYQGRKVPLGKPMQGDVKKSKVYVKGPKGNVVKVNFGDPEMKIKKSNPARRKSFRARHNCDNPGPRWKARYWSCRAW